ncbi:ubiquinol-cytochrome-c reductase complex assembly factor 3 [Fukomys damarensis]|uniref:ubiquinol-cytochrome-c reductase complex assembly factor 3 n=1 Tax=Fukomys damarensis TaxID=885580 RepID=UPI0005402A0E|nr:ubiquinol-cytochrome-c reductase complex assembly factor 3 [Fukomys damarensis]
MRALRKVLITVAAVGAGAGIGSALFALVTPGELQKQAMLKEIPEQHPHHRDEKAYTQRLVMATLQEAAATQENVAWRKNWQEGGGSGTKGTTRCSIFLSGGLNPGPSPLLHPQQPHSIF